LRERVGERETIAQVAENIAIQLVEHFSGVYQASLIGGVFNFIDERFVKADMADIERTV